MPNRDDTKHLAHIGSSLIYINVLSSIRAQYYALGRPTPDSRRVASGRGCWHCGMLTLFFWHITSDQDSWNVLRERDLRRFVNRGGFCCQRNLRYHFKFFPNLYFLATNQPAWHTNCDKVWIPHWAVNPWIFPPHKRKPCLACFQNRCGLKKLVCVLMLKQEFLLTSAIFLAVSCLVSSGWHE